MDTVYLIKMENVNSFTLKNCDNNTLLLTDFKSKTQEALTVKIYFYNTCFNFVCRAEEDMYLQETISTFTVHNQITNHIHVFK